VRQVAFSRGSPVRVVDVPVPRLRPGTVLVQTHYSAISVGTERQAAALGSMSLVGKALAKPQQVVQVVRGIFKDGLAATYERAKGALDEWLPGGYSNAGVVIAVGDEVTQLRIGDRVACGGGGHATHAEYCVVPQRLVVKVPAEVALDDAAFATIGAVAMHGFRVGEAVLGERVAVIGLGIVGQLLCQFAAAAGCRVIPMDIDPGRVRLASELTAQSGVVVGTGSDVAEVLSLTQQRGVDVVFVCAATASSEPMQLAANLARERGRLVVVGEVGLQLDRQKIYDKELDLRISRSYGPGRYDPSYEQRGIDYPYGYVRWTQQRNIESVIELLARGKLSVKPLVTHRFAIADAAQAFETLTSKEQRSPIGALFEYDTTGQHPEQRRIALNAPAPARAGKPRIALIGPGAFAKTVVLPALAKNGITPVVVAGSSGLAPTQTAARLGAEYASTDVRDVLSDASIDAVVITSRHDSHAAMVVAALEAGKHVYVEKPLAMTFDELERVVKAYNAAARSVMVGFNRRFAPFVRKLKAFLPPSVPPVITYRVNAGALPQNHWAMSSEEGGGRIIGEACHFVDLMTYLAGAPVQSVYAAAQRDATALEQNVTVLLTFRNGAIGTLVYTAQGNAQIAKEYLEVFAGGKVGIIDDFSRLVLADERRSDEQRARQDKGFADEMQAYLQHLVGGAPCPISFEESLGTSLATIGIVESYRSGAPYEVPTISVNA
jgi:predicted dehydrogenase